MGLDIAILDDEGYPSETVSLNVEEHWKIIGLAEKRNLTLIKRIEDYYENQKFSFSELEELIKEFEILLILSDHYPKVNKLLELAKSALKKEKGLSVLAD